MENIYLEKPPLSDKEGCCKRNTKKICRYRDCQERCEKFGFNTLENVFCLIFRHNLICVGTAAGVAAAFSSPITGLCFAMEEMSTHWSLGLTWQTFVCCILARSTTEFLRSITSTIEHKIEHGKEFGIFELGDSALFDVRFSY
jgi:hypothetical protein